ncbi:MAG: hypothetical protein KDI16_08985 [Halioglobus sp.]|nr:hypothetical protein [Halioglobus sp.]
MKFFDWLFRENLTREEVIDLLEAILNKTISDEDWDQFVTVQLVDPDLEKVRFRVEEMWVENSPFMVKGSIDPTDLNSKGVAEIKRLIDSISN